MDVQKTSLPPSPTAEDTRQLYWRAEFAKYAMMGFLAKHDTSIETIAKWSVSQADALIAALEVSRPTPVADGQP